ncbi:MAG: alanine racemase [Actinomycetota bacterium]
MTAELPVWVEVDLGSVRRNVERVRSMLSPGTRLLAVVKANAYGHGDVPVARAAVAGGADWLGVARPNEGAALRAAGIDVPILLLAEPTPRAVHQVPELGLVPTVYTIRTARALSDSAITSGRRLAVHVKVDTGMHRYGVPLPEVAGFFDQVTKLPGLEVQGIWSHFACAEDVLNPYTKEQHERFLDVLDELGPRANGLMRHLANSAGAITFPEAHLDMVRCGIVVYGIHPSPALRDRIDLEPALSFKSRVGYARRLPAGEALSYGQRFQLPRTATVATIPCGYADGLPRALTNTGEVLIRGRRFRISGAVTMDHFLVDAGDREIEEGDEVVILGRQGGEEILADEIAQRLGTIPYEVVCAISARVPRVYRGA